MQCRKLKVPEKQKGHTEANATCSKMIFGVVCVSFSLIHSLDEPALQGMRELGNMV